MRKFKCKECGRLFDTHVGRNYHEMWFDMRGYCVPAQSERKRKYPYECKYGCGRITDNLDSITSHEAWSKKKGYCVFPIQVEEEL